ncbi:hypothetical protein FQA39_LY08808 [Lamprigera yunnana]|nr:hypothetical protein FQA39_LY08808 [Lamprigera yunnana]
MIGIGCSIVLKGTLILTLSVTSLNAETCITPNNERAQCISLYNCLPLLKALQTQDDNIIEFVLKSHCGKWKGDPLVCCGSESNYRDFTDELHPVSCGYQHSDDYYSEANLQSSIDDFPWLSILYNPASKRARCNGAIINSLYILTTAYCASLNPTSARLGEYNIKNETDCVVDYEFLTCADKVVDIDLEDIILHPDYNEEFNNNNIAIIRVANKIDFTDYIRPICMPAKDKITPQIGDLMLASGFGLAKFKGPYVDVKKKVFTILVPNQDCVDVYGAEGSLFENLLCVKELNYNIVHLCDGDFGAPLGVFRKKRWVLEGLFHWSLDTCNSKDPKVFTKVDKYIGWIETVMMA